MQVTKGKVDHGSRGLGEQETRETGEENMENVRQTDTGLRG